jgi:hypothetical protein
MDSRAEPEVLDLDRVRIDPNCALKIPAPLALRRQVLPFAVVDGHVYVACLNPDDRNALQAVERALQLPVRPQWPSPDRCAALWNGCSATERRRRPDPPPLGPPGPPTGAARAKPKRKTPWPCATTCCGRP